MDLEIENTEHLPISDDKVKYHCIYTFISAKNGVSM